MHILSLYFKKQQTYPKGFSWFLALISAFGLTSLTNGYANTVTVSFDDTDAIALRYAIFEPFLRAGQISTAENFLPSNINKLPETLPSNWQVLVVNHETLINECTPNGKLIALDWRNIPHKDLLIPQALETCGLGYSIVGTTLAYSILHTYGTPPNSWADLFNLARYPGKRALPKQARNNFEIALLADNVPRSQIYEQLKTPQGIKRAIEKLKTIENEIIWYDTPFQLQEWLNSGEVAMAVGYDGLFLQGDGIDNIGVLRNEVIYRMRYLAIAKNSQEPSLSYALLSFATQPEQQRRYTEINPYGIVLQQSALLLGENLSQRMTSSPKNLQQGLLEDYNFYAEHHAAMQTAFQEWQGEDDLQTIVLEAQTVEEEDEFADFMGPLLPPELRKQTQEQDDTSTPDNANTGEAAPAPLDETLVSNCEKPLQDFISAPSKVGIDALKEIDNASACWNVLIRNDDRMQKLYGFATQGNQAAAIYLSDHIQNAPKTLQQAIIPILGQFSDKNMESFIIIASREPFNSDLFKEIISSFPTALLDQETSQKVDLLTSRTKKLNLIKKSNLSEAKAFALTALNNAINVLKESTTIETSTDSTQEAE